MAREFKVAIAAPDGDIDNPAFTFEADPNTGMYRVGTDQLAFTTGGVANVIVDPDGVYLSEEVSITNGSLTVGTGGSVVINQGDVTANGDVTHTHGSGRVTAMMDLEVLSWMD